jgi:hypothetical protein
MLPITWVQTVMESYTPMIIYMVLFCVLFMKFIQHAFIYYLWTSLIFLNLIPDSGTDTWNPAIPSTICRQASEGEELWAHEDSLVFVIWATKLKLLRSGDIFLQSRYDYVINRQFGSLGSKFWVLSDITSIVLNNGYLQCSIIFNPSTCVCDPMFLLYICLLLATVIK